MIENVSPACDDIDQDKIKFDCIYSDDDSSMPSLVYREDSSDDESISSVDSFEDEYDDIRDDVVYSFTTDVEYHVPDPKARPQTTPVSIMMADTIGCCRSRKILKVLFDSGSEKTLISQNMVPEKAVPCPTEEVQLVRTLAGKMKATKVVNLRDIRLPEFDKNRRIESQKALVYLTSHVNMMSFLAVTFCLKSKCKSTTKPKSSHGLTIPYH